MNGQDQMNVELEDHLAAAEKAYDELVSMLKDGKKESAGILLDTICPMASNYRGMLLGRPWGTGATYDEFYWSRLKVDVSHTKVEFNVCTGHFTTHADTANKLSFDAITLMLKRITDYILIAFPEQDRSKFDNKGVVNTLHGIFKQNIRNKKTKASSFFHLSQHQVGYTKLNLMLRYCLRTTANTNSKVTCKTATEAYNIYVKEPAKDPTCKDSEDVDINILTKGYGEALEKFFTNGHLDVQAGWTSAEVGNLSPDSDVTSYTVGSVGSEFHVWVINNPISNTFMEEVTKSMNELKFVKGVLGKKDAFIRVASSTSEPAPLVIAGHILYEGVRMAPIELKLTQLVYSLMHLQTQMIQSLIGRRFKITWHVNLIHTVAASINKAMYAAHTDADNLLCSDNDVYCHVAEDRWLPKRGEMQTATLVISNSKNSQSTKLVYKHRQGAMQPKAIPLSNNCLHIQGPGSQAGDITHEVDIMPNTVNDGSTYRYHCTFRFTLDPMSNQDEYEKRKPLNINTRATEYKEINVIDRCSGMTHHVADFDSISDEPGDSSHLRKDDHLQGCGQKPESEDTQGLAKQQPLVGRFDLKSRLCRDTYPNLPPEFRSDSLCAPHRAGPRVRLGGSMIQELSSGPMVRMMFNRNYLLDVVHNEDVIIPCLHHVKTKANEPMYLPIPGEEYQMSTILADAGLIHTDRSHPIMSTNDNHHNVMVLSQSYKNDVDSITEYVSKVDAWVKSERSTRLFDDDFKGDIRIYGSGGSPDVLGTYAPSPNRDSKDDPQVVIPFHQNMEHPINSKLGKMVVEGQVVAVYLNELIFYPDLVTEQGSKAENTDPKLLFLGHFWCTSYRINREDDDADADHHVNGKVNVAEEEQGDVHPDELLLSPVGTQQEQMYSRFREAPYIEATLSPILRDKELNLLLARRNGTNQEKFRVVSVPVKCSDKIEMEIGLGEANIAASLHPKKKVLRKTVLHHFIRTGGLDKYCKNTSEDESLVSYEEDEEHTLDEMYLSEDANSDSDYNDQDTDDPLSSSLSSDDKDAGLTAIVSRKRSGAVAAVHRDWAVDNLPPTKIGRMMENSSEQKTKSGTLATRGISVCLKDIVQGVLLNSVAGALRYQEQCLVDHNGISHGQSLPTVSLPSIFRQHPTPMSNRTLDVINVAQRRIAMKSSVFDRCKTDADKRIVYQPSFRSDLIQSLFTSILLRFTGRIGAFNNFALQLEQDNKIPLIDDLDEFLSYMEATVARERSMSLSLWTSQQHAMSIPKTTKHFTEFSKFLRRVAQYLPGVIDHLLDPNSTRSEAVIHLGDKLLEWCNNDSSGHLKFLAQQILADVEELFEDPFGAVLPGGVIGGPGGSPGFAMLKKGGGATNFANALKVIIEYMTTDAPLIWLELAGYHRTITGEVINLINGRPFNATDAEHFLCKAWTVAKHTLGHYRNSGLPHFTKPHCHPMRQKDTDESLTNIMINIVRAYNDCIGSKVNHDEEEGAVLTVPNFCLLPGEVPWSPII